MSKPATLIIGNYLSPYVRKILACLHLKGVAYSLDPIVPFYGNDEFARLSPLRRIPVLQDDRVTLADSTVIAEYLDERYPTPPLYPRDLEQRARARWLEEYADTRIADVLIWRYFNQLVIRPYIWGETPDDVVVEKVLNEDLPDIMDYLTTQVPAQGFLFGELQLADIAIAVHFRNAEFAGLKLDAQRWPVVVAYVQRVLDHPALADLRPFEAILLKTPVAQQREALHAAGAPLSEKSYSSNKPRRGLFAV